MTYSDDMLRDMLETQKHFQNDLGYDFDKMSFEKRVEYIFEYSRHLEHEIHEMMQELPYFKSWKQYTGNTGELVAMFRKAQAEWADVMHFFLNVTLALGLNANDLYVDYMQKHSTNHDRQKNTEIYKKCVDGLGGNGEMVP